MSKLPIFNITAFVLLSFFLLLFQFTPAYSSPADELEKDIEQTEEEIKKNESNLRSIEARIKEISNSNYSVSQKINLLSAEVEEIETVLEAKNSEIEEKLEEIAQKEEVIRQKKDLVASVSSQLYMESRVGTVEFFFSNSRIDDVIHSFFVKKSTISLLKDEITEITGEFESLTVLKQELESEKTELDSQKKDLDDSHNLLLAERAKLQRELNETYNSRNLVSRTINGLKSELSDLQYHLLVVRQGGTNVNASSVPGSTDNKSTLPGFLANAPSDTFAVFSIGAYTHRNGMSQWGARARADSGQSYTQILNHYYPSFIITSGYPEPATVTIRGDGLDCNNNAKYYNETLNFDTYMNRIFEMPASWNPEAVKAQAIATRSFAIHQINRNGYIRPNQSDQVYKNCGNGSGWINAVNATKGQVLTSGGSAAFSQYAAVHGGWSNTSGWDTTDGSGSGDWMARAYDSISRVSWFYQTWYTSGSSTCGRNPWMTQTEMSDIVNAYQVWAANGGSDGRIVPVYDACHSSGNPYSYSELRKLAAKPVSSISAVVTSNSNGSTGSITFYTNAGNITIPASYFKTIYNMRAPGHLHIPQNGFVHINIEKK
ncbi:MAG: SpoIID/LytB domain-containing protein [Candidatus Dojkabacteria bacterium]